MIMYTVAIFSSPMGHDIVRVSARLTHWLTETGLFNVRHASWYQDAPRSVDDYMADASAVAETDLFLLNCPDDPFTTEKSRRSIENAVASGAGLLGFHGIQPSCHRWPEMEKMIGLLWRDTASHGDYDWFTVSPAAGSFSTRDGTGTLPSTVHPILTGLQPFRTKEELYCGLTNVLSDRGAPFATGGHHGNYGYAGSGTGGGGYSGNVGSFGG